MARKSQWYFQDPAAPEPTRPRTLGVTAIIEREGSILLERRTDAPLWSLISGMVEEDESLADALRREVAEETGLSVSAFELFGTFTDPTRIVSYPDGNVNRVASFAYSVDVETFDGLRASSESEALRFFRREELRELALPATQRPIIDALLSDRTAPHLS